MGRTKKVGSTGRFGARGGSTVRKKRAAIERVLKANHECPHCLSIAVKKVSVGKWKCHKCGYTFAGAAYIPKTKLGTSMVRKLTSVAT